MSDMRFIEQGVGALRAPGARLTATLTELVQLAVNAAKSEAGSLFLMDEQRRVLKAAVTVGLPAD
jgi:hypothetical protein